MTRRSVARTVAGTEALHHTTVMVDVQGSSALTNPQKVAMRAALSTAVGAAVAASGTDPDAWYVEDRGDGKLITVAAGVPKVRVLGAWQVGLDRALRAHNTAHPANPPVRVRVGVHAGEVHTDADGVAGADLELACRLADAPAARRALDAAPGAVLALVVSDLIYDSVVRHGGRHVDPDRFCRIRVVVKELDVPAWLAVAGCPVPPVAPADRYPAPAGDETKPAARPAPDGTAPDGTAPDRAAARQAAVRQAAPGGAAGPRVSMQATTGEHGRIYQSGRDMVINE